MCFAYRRDVRIIDRYYLVSTLIILQGHFQKEKSVETNSRYPANPIDEIGCNNKCSE